MLLPLSVHLLSPSYRKGNLGTIIRTAYGMGVDAVIVVDGCDSFSPKVLRSAMGMSLKLPIYEVSWKDDEVSKLLDGSSCQVLLADADPGGSIYHKVDMTVPTVIVIGSEAIGIGIYLLLYLYQSNI